MTLRARHGNAKKHGIAPVLEVLPADELPAPIPAPPDPVTRRHDGTVDTPEAAKALGAKGGRTKGNKVKLASALGLKELAETAPFQPYYRAGCDFVKQHLQELAKAAGGSVGPGPSTMVASAGLQLAASRFWFDVASETLDPGLMKLASGLANDSRTSLMGAYEYAQREAQARPRTHNTDPLAAYRLPKETP